MPQNLIQVFFQANNNYSHLVQILCQYQLSEMNVSIDKFKLLENWQKKCCWHQIFVPCRWLPGEAKAGKLFLYLLFFGVYLQAQLQ